MLKYNITVHVNTSIPQIYECRRYDEVTLQTVTHQLTSLTDDDATSSPQWMECTKQLWARQ
jgi:pterin-4a-carbinolamine dehydratase